MRQRHLRGERRAGSPAYCHCRSCQTAHAAPVVAAAIPPFPRRAIFPSLCETSDWFKPAMHVHWQDHLLDMKDDLPKFLDFPERMGGTEKMA